MSSKKQIIHEYLYQKVKPVYDELISKILIERPDDVIQWSIDWLHNKSNCFYLCLYRKYTSASIANYKQNTSYRT